MQQLRIIFLSDKLNAMTENNTSKPLGGARPGAGRPGGSRTTVASGVLLELRTARSLTQMELAQELGIPFSTYRRYETQQLIPKSGLVRSAINRAARRAGVSLEAKAEEVRA